MRKNIFSVGIILFLSVLILGGCKKKDDEQLPPTISFKTGASYTQDGAIVQVGHKLFFGIHAEGISESITNFTVKKYLDNGTVITVMDTGLFNQTLDLDKIFYQNVEDKATWKFAVMDRNHMSAEVSMVIYKDPNSTYGGIFYYPSIKLGYQNNTTYGHFLDPNTGMVYMDDSATAHHDKIDVLIYYIISNGLPSPVLSSPGEMDNASTEAQTYYPFIANWSPRNYTLWDISFDNGNNTPLTAADFDAAQNDSLLIVSYHDVWGKKKFRFGTTGKIVPFLTAGGKLGLIKVNSADSTDTGIMDISVKIQQ
ncbi:MAG TPA: hypothetical protein PKK00_09295 [Bacteroidales bacterium]|nr:hypothetical protein [Bacteroidales bacterium]HPS17488.1 hypothetical protein [Bacteroidales bacterium]